MSEKSKRIIFIIGFLILVVALGFLLYLTFFKPLPKAIQDAPSTPSVPTGLPGQSGDGPTVVETPETTIIPGLPVDQTRFEIASPTAQGGITQTQLLENDDIQNVTINANGNSLNYYNKDDGKFYKVDKNGNVQELSDKAFANVETVTWAPDSDKTILEFPDGANVYYDLTTGKQVTLPQAWTDFSFNKSSSEIAFKEEDSNPDFNWLSIANPDGSGKRSVEHLGINSDDVTVSYSPNNQIVAYYTEPDAPERSKVYFIGKNEENFKAAVVEGYGVKSKWTPEGDKLLYSSYSQGSDYIPELWIVNSQGNSIGENRINLGLKTTADKCTVTSDTTVYCAVPQETVYGSGLEPDLMNEIPDDIYKIDLRTGLKTKIAETDVNTSIDQIIVNDSEDTLYFMDGSENSLRKMNL